jgi:hypothetical protein
MTRCEYAIIFAMTIGDYLEQISAQLSQNNMVLQSTVLDAIGSGAVEKFAAIFQETVNEMAAARRMVASRRFSLVTAIGTSASRPLSSMPSVMIQPGRTDREHADDAAKVDLRHNRHRATRQGHRKI